MALKKSEPFVPKNVSPPIKENKNEAGKASAKKALAALEDDGFVISRFSATPAPSNKPSKPEKKTP